MATNLLLSGGPGHDFDATTAVLTGLLAEEGVASTVVEDPHEAVRLLAEEPGGWDLLTVNALRWRMDGARHAAGRGRWACALAAGEAALIEGFVRGGGGLLACHTAAICFDADPHWAACLGATWSWERSSHPPQGEALVTATRAGRSHPITAGIEELTTVDEVYGFLDGAETVEPLLTSAHGGADHPVLWARTLGGGRVVVDLLGHDAAAVRHPTHAEVLRRAARWLLSSAVATAPSTPPTRSDPAP